MKQSGLRVITGQDPSAKAATLRGALALIEPFYAGVMKLRNIAYDSELFRSHDLYRPTISVGNITTGGTGKTPVVIWLAQELRRLGHRPAILLRGYGANANHKSDEAQLLDESLNASSLVNIPVQPNPSRVQAAADVLRGHPHTTHFILDDGFQHRRAKRDFNLVLISATDPFGSGHVLPRGLLREPLSGLKRAHAFLITRCSLASTDALTAIEKFLNAHHPATPIFHCDHRQSSLFLPATNQTAGIEFLRAKKVFLSAGIGDPAAFERQIAASGCTIAGTKWWPDHHDFDQRDISSLSTAATAAGADLILTTAKDWVKIKPLSPSLGEMSVGVANIEIHFPGDDDMRLLQRVVSATSKPITT